MKRLGVGDVRISARARHYVQQVLDSGRLSYGPWSKEFERRFAEIHGKRFACFVSSGTDALRIGLGAMKEKYGWQDHWRVLVPAVTFVATFNIVLQNRMVPYLVDIETEHFGMAPTDSYARHPVAAAIPVNLFGHVPPQRPSFPALVDSCETMFVPSCADGDVAAFSTYTAHLITTGVGGLVLTDDADLARIIRSLANHGRNGIYTDIDMPLGDRETMDARFFFEREGYSSRGTELQAALGCAELDDWEENIQARRRNARQLVESLWGLPLALPKYPVTDSAWMMVPILSEQRDDLVLHLERLGIETRPLLPLTSQPHVRNWWKQSTWRDIDETLPVAARVNREGFYCGIHPGLTEADIDYMAKAFRSFYAP